MRSRIILLAMLAALSPAVARGQEYAPPAGTERPIPIYSSNPSCGSLVLSGRYPLGLSTGSWTWGLGWLFPDGNALEVRCGGTRRAEVTLRQSIYDNETDRYSRLLGTGGGFRGEWYLGQGFATYADLMAPLLQSRIGLHWYPYEGVDLMLECAPLQLKGWWGWAIAF